MDETKEYQEMLKAAPEIQKLWSPNVGDYHTWNGDISVIGRMDFKSITHHEIRDKTVWGDREQYGQYIVGYFNEWVIMEFNSTTPYNAENIVKQFQEIYTEYDNCLWLPRQDQLQDMLKHHPFSWDYFDKECVRMSWIQYEGVSTTKEQAGLMVVMFQTYNKKWNGEEWTTQ